MTHPAVWRVLRRTALLVLVPTLAGLPWGTNVGSLSAGSDAAPAAAPRASIAGPPTEWRPLDPAKVEGHAKCVDCHKSEIVAWQQSKHAAQAFDMLRIDPKAAEYAEKLGIRRDGIARNSLCTKCHSTPQHTATGAHRTLGGVSCESCHNAAGGEDGWLNPHAVYGPPGTRREQESPEHFQQRMAVCRKAGQYRSADVYALAKSCFECHVVSEEELVVKAEHPTGAQFELVAWSQGEVRHNFQLNQRQNAAAPSLWMTQTGATPSDRKRLLWVVGQLVDIEVGLRNFGKARDEKLSGPAAQRITAAHGLLTSVVEQARLPDVQAVLDEVAKLMDKLFQPPTPDQKAEFDQAADKVAAAAKKFSQSYDGSTLTAVDALLPSPESLKGTVFEPQ